MVRVKFTLNGKEKEGTIIRPLETMPNYYVISTTGENGKPLEVLVKKENIHGDKD